MLTKAIAVLACATSLLLIVIGLVSFPLYALAMWAAMSVMLGLVAWQQFDESTRWAGLRAKGWTPRRAGAGFSVALFFAGVLAAAALSVFGFVSGSGVLAVVVPAGVWAILRRTPGEEATEPPSGGGSGVREPVVLSPSAVPGLAVDELCRTWRRTYAQLLDTRESATRDRLALVRQACLDELERRDPAGFRRWLADGARAGSDPGRFIAAGRGLVEGG